VDALVGQALPEVLSQHLVGRAEDEVDDLDRGVDDAELVDGLLERGGEELVVELDDDLLPALGVSTPLTRMRTES
jgi:hypothetical protein